MLIMTSKTLIKMKSNELEPFHTAFVDVQSGLKEGSVSADTIRVLYRDQIKNHPDLKYDMAMHWRAKPTEPAYTLEWLKDIVTQHLERNRKADVAKKIHEGIAKGPAPAAAAKKKGGGKGKEKEKKKSDKEGGVLCHRSKQGSKII